MDAQTYDRLHLVDDAAVLALLHACAADHPLCSVRAAGRPESYLSRLLGIEPDGTPVLDPPRAAVIERQLVPGRIAAIEVRRPDGAVQFEAPVVAPASAPMRGTVRAPLRLARPTELVHLQRRATVRVRLPADSGVLLTVDPNDVALRAVPVLDLSIQGCAATATGVRVRLEPGVPFESGQVHLPDGTVWPVSMRIAHAAQLRRHGDGADVRFGIQFLRATSAFETAIARIVGQTVRSTAMPVRPQ